MTETSRRLFLARRGFWAAAAALNLLVGIAAGPALAGPAPQVAVDEDGISELTWDGHQLLGRQGFAVQRLTFEKPDGENAELFGRSLQEAKLAPPRKEALPDQNKVIHHYDWGRAELTAKAQPDTLRLELTLVNGSDKALADFRVRLAELAFPQPQPQFKHGYVQIAVDRPHYYKASFSGAKCLLTYESMDVPVQYGFSQARGEKGRQNDLIVLGGAPGIDPQTRQVPLMGLPHIPAGKSLTMRFVLRFGPATTPDASLLIPYYRTYYEQMAPRLDWPDRRPIGKVAIPSAPPYVTNDNPRGWFHQPQMDVGTAAGQAELREKLMALAETCIENLKAVGAQGMFVWNIEGGHVYADTPMGDPRHLPKIAPEMDALADAFFAKFRQAGLRTGVCIRPSLLHYSEARQRWTNNSGVYDPNHETYPGLEGKKVSDLVYPIVARMSAKIDYAKKRWGCTLFYIHDNGYWWQASASHYPEWILLDARILRELRQRHPDVLLIPRYAERYWRSARSRHVGQKVREHLADLMVEGFGDSLRSIKDARIGGLPTPEWIVGHKLLYERTRRAHAGRALPDQGHALRQSYWAVGAPYVELKLRQELIDYITTLEQHMEYSEEQAKKMADSQIAFETTPDRVREWMPDAVTVIDIDGAPVGLRGGELAKAAAWGDVLMWDAAKDPTLVAAFIGGARNKQRRIEQAGSALGLVRAADDGPLMPISLIWRQGRPVDPTKLIAGPTPEGLRVRWAPGPDGTEGLLMLAWRGSQGYPVQLKTDLSAIELAGRWRGIWQLPSGASFAPGQAVTVKPDPTAGLSTLLISTTADRPAPRPAGVLLGATFEAGLAPTAGGGLPARGAAKAPARTGKLAGGAVVLDGQGQAEYNVVPDWLGGTAEFDLQVPDSLSGSLAVLTLRHWADVQVSLASQGGKVGLGIEATEQTADGNGQTRKAFASLPGGGWKHVVLIWELGQYALVVDGKELAVLSAPAAAKRRDATLFRPGLIVGGPGGGGRAALDNLAVYDWAMSAEQAIARKRNDGARPLARPDRPPVHIWAWGDFPENVTVAINATGLPMANEIRTFRITLYERLEGGRRQVASADVGAFGGVTVTNLKYKPVKKVESKGALGMETKTEMSLDVFDEMDGDGMADIVGEMGKGGKDLRKPFTVVVQPLPQDRRTPPQSVNLSVDRDGPERNRWPSTEGDAP